MNKILETLSKTEFLGVDNEFATLKTRIAENQLSIEPKMITLTYVEYVVLMAALTHMEYIQPMEEKEFWQVMRWTISYVGLNLPLSSNDTVTITISELEAYILRQVIRYYRDISFDANGIFDISLTLLSKIDVTKF